MSIKDVYNNEDIVKNFILLWVEFYKTKEVIRNFHLNNYDLNKLQYFIDLPIIGHIIGVLWILRCKYLLDDKLYKKCYGNLKKILKIDKILKLVEMDKTLLEACEKVNLDVSLVRLWLNKEKHNSESFTEFYKRYNQSLTNQLNNHESEIEDYFNLIRSDETIIRACKSLN